MAGAVSALQAVVSGNAPGVLGDVREVFVKPEPDIIVGLDQASRSGWAIQIGGPMAPVMVHNTGVARSAKERYGVVTAAHDKAEGDPRRILVVVEDHSGMPLSRGTRHDRSAQNEGRAQRTTATILGMGDARGRWLEQFELLGVPNKNLVRVEPRVWRAAIFGKSSPAIGTAAAKALAKQWASAVVRWPVQDDNQAEAIAIATWGAREGRPPRDPVELFERAGFNVVSVDGVPRRSP